MYHIFKKIKFLVHTINSEIVKSEMVILTEREKVDADVMRSKGREKIVYH
jgi:hypothetical protein